MSCRKRALERLLASRVVEKTELPNDFVWCMLVSPTNRVVRHTKSYFVVNTHGVMLEKCVSCGETAIWKP